MTVSGSPGSRISRFASANEAEARVALIERAAAWRLVARALGGARAGSGSTLLVHGPNGIGKTALLQTAQTLARESGMRVLTASGRARERDFRFSVTVQLLEAELVDMGAPPPLSATFDALHGLFDRCRSLAQVAGLVLVVDDADLADEASLRFLLYLAERVDELPIALLLAAGTIGPAAAPASLRQIARLSSTTRCRLESLSPHGTQRRVAKSWPTVDEDAAEEIHRASGGNPFLVAALASAFAGEEASEHGDEPRPLSALAPALIADWALACAADIDDRAPAVLRALSLLGSGCLARHVGALADLELPEVTKALDALADAGILAEGEPLAFAQPIVASAVANAQAPGERALRSLQAAELLRAEEADAERVAEYVMFASRTGQDWVVDTLSEAAARALDRAAPHDAVRYLRRALDEPPSKQRRGQVMLELGRAEAAAGDPHAADRLTDVVGRAAEVLGDPADALDAGRTLFALGRPREAMLAFERALRHVSEPDSDIAGRLAAGRETAAWLVRLADGRDGEVRPAPASAAAPGDRVLLALHAVQSAFRGDSREAVQDAASRALANGTLLDDETSDGMSYYLAAMALAYTEDLQLAEAALTAAVEDAKSRGSLLGFGTASQMRATTILLRGRLRDAAADARYALAVERHGWRLGINGARVVLANVCIERGHLEGADKQLDAAEEGTGAEDPFRLMIFGARGRVQLDSGDTGAALESFLASGRVAEGAGIRNPAVAPWRSYAGLATAAMGDWAEAERLIQSELSVARACGIPGATGRALRALASIHPPADALEILESAVETLNGSQAALERAFALVDFGAAMRRAGRRRDALAPLREGLDLAQRCGADALVSRALREAHTAGARPRRAAIHGEDALTPREQQVASLAADGLSNREIADQLVVTVKTVEWHLQHVFRKLGVRSRKDMAGKLASGEPDPHSL